MSIHSPQSFDRKFTIQGRHHNAARSGFHGAIDYQEISVQDADIAHTVAFGSHHERGGGVAN
jgi:hypothetical protein